MELGIIILYRVVRKELPEEAGSIPEGIEEVSHVDSWATVFLAEEAEGWSVFECVCARMHVVGVRGVVGGYSILEEQQQKIVFQIPNILIFGMQKQEIKISSNSQSLKLFLKYFQPSSYSC